MLRRKPVNKYKSARSFRSQTTRTKSINMRNSPQRGGFRL